MPISLKVASSSGGFRATFFSGRLNVASGTSGNILSLTAPAGKKIRLTGLVSGTSAETGITVTCDDVVVINNLTLSQTQPTTSGSFAIGASTSTNLGQGAGSIDFIEAKSTIVITKVSGSTSTTIGYSYAYGE